MKRLYIVLFAALTIITAHASEPGSGGCYSCLDVYHHSTVKTCYDNWAPYTQEVPCNTCQYPPDVAYPTCVSRTQDYYWSCSYCATSAQHVGGFTGNSCVMQESWPATAPPNVHCPSCTVYGACSTEGRLEQLDGDDTEMARLAQIESGTSIASMVEGIQKFSSAGDYAAFEDRVTAETEKLPEPARSIAVSRLYVTQMHAVAQVQNAAVMSSRRFRLR